MQTFIITFGFLLIAVAAMAVGVMMGRKPIKGSCGGINALPGIKRACDCEEPCDQKIEALKNKGVEI